MSMGKKKIERQPAGSSNGGEFAPKHDGKVPPTAQRIIRSSGSVPSHPALANNVATIPWIERAMALGAADREYKLAKNALDLTDWGARASAFEDDALADQAYSRIEAEGRLALALEAVMKAQKSVDEPQFSDTYYVVRGLLSRNQCGWVVFTKSEGKKTQVLLEFRDANHNPTSQKWFPLKKLKRSLIYQGLI